MHMRSAVFCIIWYASIFFGFHFLYVPVLPLLLLKPNVYRRVTDGIFRFWELYSVALLELLCNVTVITDGDAIDLHENSIILMNHRTRVDWLFLWCLINRSPFYQQHNCKFVIKESIKKIPALGWAMQMTRFIYVKRNWKYDQNLMGNMLDYLLETSDNLQVLLYPEGTDLSLANIIKDESYAKSKGLKCYKYLLHPRTTGLKCLFSRMQRNGALKAVYDVTIGYPDLVPQNIIDLFSKGMPENIFFHVKRHCVQNLPVDGSGIRNWCQLQWERKEVYLMNFYEMSYSEKFRSEKINFSSTWNHQMTAALIFWTLLVFFGIILLSTFHLVTWLIILQIVFFGMLSSYTRGLDHLEVYLYNLLKRGCKGKVYK